MNKQHVAFKAYDTDSKLRLVGSGTPPDVGRNAGIRWEIGRVEPFTFASADEAREFVLAETKHLSRD